MPSPLAAWLAWLRIPDCACPWEAQPIGSATNWQTFTRTQTNPDCSHHGGAAGADVIGRQR